MLQQLPSSFASLIQLLVWLALLAELAASAQEPAQQAKAARAEKQADGRALAGLLQEAEKAKNPVVRAFFLRLAVPHDELQLRDPKSTIWLAPLPRPVDLKKALPGDSVHGRRLDALGRPLEDEAVPVAQLTAIVHFEALAVVQVDEFLKRTLPLAREESLQHAEQALAHVLRFHETARERGQRLGAGWEDPVKALRARLLAVRLERLRALADAGKWDSVGELADRLAQLYPNHEELRAAEIRVRVLQAGQLLKNERTESFVQVRRLVEQLEGRYPGCPSDAGVRGLCERLQQKARQHEKLARALAARDRDGAGEQYRLAESIWPQLPELRTWRESPGLSVLYVGVRELPRFLSPALASTDAERQAVELLFESLVRPVAEPGVGQRYESVLAAGSPALLAPGRDFRIIENARWYREAGKNTPAIDQPLTATDVRDTLRLLQKAGHAPDWADLFAAARVEGDRFRIGLTLRQGCFEPLSLMAFKVLPAHLLGSPNDPDFAKAPVGSGPYLFHGIHREGKPPLEQAVFRANPRYRSRAGKSNQPYVNELRLFRCQDPRSDFQKGPPGLHLLLDLPTRKAKELKSSPLPHVKVHTLRNRRIWFLAVNHRHPPLRDESTRRAIAHAVDREAILTGCFRALDAGADQVHRPLNGPYPAGSWAADPSLRPDPFDAGLARNQAQAARAKQLTFTLKYPDDSAEVERACADIKSHVRQHAGITLELKACAPYELRRAVEEEHDYQLAYYHWDYADDTYWLWPLFDPNASAQGGRNFLGRIQDPALEGLFRQLLDYRQFERVQAMTRRIHRRIYDSMPLIPLWQLDTHLAIHESVKTVPAPDRLDPLRIFTHIERWEVGK